MKKVLVCLYLVSLFCVPQIEAMYPEVTKNVGPFATFLQRCILLSNFTQEDQLLLSNIPCKIVDNQIAIQTEDFLIFFLLESRKNI
jgi:hypothetical protein